jgi:hypothetical protein
VKGILRYVCGTMDLGLSITASSSTDIVAYSDADWAGCPDTQCSTSGYCVYLGSSMRQHTVSRSSAKAEYRVVANAVAECTWLRQFFSELACPIDKATVVFCNNVSVVYLSASPFIIAAPSTLSWISTLFVSRLLSVMFEFFTYRPPSNLPTS